MTNQIKTTPRYLALNVLTRVIERGAYSNLQLNNCLNKANNDADRRLITRLVYGVLQHRLTLEYWLAPFVHRPLDGWVKTLLIMSIYQYEYLDRVPQWAVTNEAINIARVLGNQGTRRFVTAVLHSFLRQGPRDFDELSAGLQRWSIEYSVPEWLVQELLREYGQQNTLAILRSVNEPAHISIRVNIALSSVNQVKAHLHDEGVDTEYSQIASAGLVVKSGNVLQTQAFKQGLVTVQDESAMLAVEAMHLAGDEQVLDACAAPGGKSGQIAEALLHHGGHLTSLDIHPHKVALIARNMQRLQVNDVVTPMALDARHLNQQFSDEYFDKALVDAPCSGIGLIRRKPEIRYDKTLADSQHLHEIQLSILNAVAPKIKKGGILLYSTCTILKGENDGTVQAFLADHPNYALMVTKTARTIKNDRQKDTLTILPSDYGSDGFFIAVLKRMK